MRWLIGPIIHHRSTVKPNTLSPVWNELWKVKNVPNTATLTVEVLDKDNGNITDDHIGKFSTSVSAGAKECAIESMSLRRNRGTFWLNVGCIAIIWTSMWGAKPDLDRINAIYRRQGRAETVCLRRPYPILSPLFSHRRPFDQLERCSSLFNVEDIHQGCQNVLWRHRPALE